MMADFDRKFYRFHIETNHEMDYLSLLPMFELINSWILDKLRLWILDKLRSFSRNKIVFLFHIDNMHSMNIKHI